MKRTISTVVVFSNINDRVTKKIPSYEPLTTAAMMSKNHPCNVIGIFEHPKGKLGEAWFFFPEEHFE
jgi:hypothetical protein